jgi:hypothetical protein
MAFRRLKGCTAVKQVGFDAREIPSVHSARQQTMLAVVLGP